MIYLTVEWQQLGHGTVASSHVHSLTSTQLTSCSPFAIVTVRRERRVMGLSGKPLIKYDDPVAVSIIHDPRTVVN